jgi:uncharacterized protein (TIGR03663 family)
MRPATPPSRIWLSPQVWIASVIYIAAAALLLRMIALDTKPLHHDEGVNAFFLTNLVRPPHVYRYDPANYHGPTLYYLAWASAWVFGLSDFALRFVPAVFGLLTIALVLPLRRKLGDIGTLAAAGLLALSPGAVFHSRYFIHESILVCSTLALVVAGHRFLCNRRVGWLLLAALAAAGMTATKETWIVSAGVLICAGIGTAVWCRWRGRAAAFARLTLPGPSAVMLATAVFVGVNLLFYTSFFTNWAGAVDSFRTFTVWAKTGQSAHTHPWFMYFWWLFEDELFLLVLGVAGAALALWRGTHRFAVSVGLWAIGTIAAYSLIPYKTPWLTLNLLPPLALSAGWLIDSLVHTASATYRRLGLVAAAAGAALMTYQTVVVNFVHYDDERYAYVYAQTNRELLALVDAIAALIGRTSDRVPVIVMSPDQFPLSWYLRDVAAAYPGSVQPATRGVVVAAERQAEEVARVLGDRFVRLGHYQLRSGVVLVLYASRDLTGTNPSSAP